MLVAADWHLDSITRCAGRLNFFAARDSRAHLMGNEA